MDQVEKEIRKKWKPVIDRHKKKKNKAALDKYEKMILLEIKQAVKRPKNK